LEESQWDGFGDGVDPSNYGMNIYNESILFHEALHGMTGLYDRGTNELEAHLALSETVQIAGQSYSVGTSIISMYMKDNVLNSCPISGRPGN
jgi:hypothetical protein